MHPPLAIEKVISRPAGHLTPRLHIWNSTLDLRTSSCVLVSLSCVAVVSSCVLVSQLCTSCVTEEFLYWSHSVIKVGFTIPCQSTLASKSPRETSQNLPRNRFLVGESWGESHIPSFLPSFEHFELRVYATVFITFIGQLPHWRNQDRNWKAKCTTLFSYRLASDISKYFTIAWFLNTDDVTHTKWRNPWLRLRLH